MTKENLVLLGLTLTPLPEGGWETRIQGYRALVRQTEGGYEALCPDLDIQVERETLQEALEDVDTMVTYTVVEMLEKRAGANAPARRLALWPRPEGIRR